MADDNTIPKGGEGQENPVPPWDTENDTAEASMKAFVSGKKPKLAVAAADGVIQPRPVPEGGLGPAEELAAMRALRKIARDRGLVVAGPTRLLRQTAKRYTRQDNDSTKKALTLNWHQGKVLLGNEALDDDESSLLAPHIKILEALAELYDLEEQHDAPRMGTHETGRWPLFSPENVRIGYVSRVDDRDEKNNARKRYIAHFWRKGGWFAAPVPPCDLLPFGMEVKEQHPDALLVEGPKTRDAALELAKQNTTLGLALRKHIILAWHGAEDGVAHTDWSACAGRTIRLMCDTDEAGLTNMLAAADAISLAGGRPVLLRLGTYDEDKGLDFADKEYVKMFGDWPTDAEPLFRNVVAPFLPTKFDDKGKPLPPVIAPHFRDSWVWIPAAKGIFSNITQEEYDYESFSAKYLSRGKHTTANRLKSDPRVLQARGVSYLPGSPFGLQRDNIFNVAVPSPLWGLPPAETALLPRAFVRYLKSCIPDPIAREALLDFAAHAIAFPNERPGWGVLMKGSPNGGKTTLSWFLGSLPGRMVEAPVEGILGQFQSPEIMYAAAIFVEELFDYTGGQGHAIYQRSKAFITSPTRQMNIKGKPQFSIRNVARLWCTSNQANALMLEADDRRWLVVDFQGNDLAVYEAANPEKNRVAIYQALLCRGRRNGRALPSVVPRTAAKDEMSDAVLSRGEVRLRAFVEALKEDECVLASDLKVEFGLSDQSLRKMHHWGMSPLGQVRFPRYEVKDAKGETRSRQPQYSVWRKVGDSPAQFALTGEEVAKMLRRVGVETSRAILDAKAGLPKATDNPSA